MKKIRENIISYTIDKAIFGNFSILVDNGEVIVKAPWYFSKQRIQEAIKENKRWILKKLSEMEEVTLYNTTKILGVNYAIKVIYTNVKTPGLNLNNNYIEIKLPIKLKGKNNNKIIEIILNKMYIKLAEKHLENIFEEIRIETGLAPEEYSIDYNIKEMAKFDFEKKEIYINSKIMELEESCIKYIVIHELCHLKYKTHAKSFYNLVKKYFPKYEKYDEILNGYKF